ncbi:MAG: hypothetical protein AAGF77_12475 [Bacteroidota bacterium]
MGSYTSITAPIISNSSKIRTPLNTTQLLQYSPTSYYAIEVFPYIYRDLTIIWYFNAT